jgi:nicotinamidase-related amidase
MVIDVQVGMFLEPNPVHNANGLLRNIKSLIERARSSGTPIIYVQHNARLGKPLEPGSPRWEIHPATRPIDGDSIIQKTTPDSFYESNLHQVLSEKKIKNLFWQVSKLNSV